MGPMTVVPLTSVGGSPGLKAVKSMTNMSPNTQLETESATSETEEFKITPQKTNPSTTPAMPVIKEEAQPQPSTITASIPSDETPKPSFKSEREP